MSRCARCGVNRTQHHIWFRQPSDPPSRVCPLFTPRDPLWIRILARIGKGRL